MKKIKKLKTKPYQNPNRRLTRSQSLFVNEIVLGANGTQAALKAYNINGRNKENIASVIASRTFGNVRVQNAIVIQSETLKTALKANGVTLDKVAERINDLLEAQTPIYKNNNATKQIELVGHSPDFGAIDKGLRHALNIYGIQDIIDKPAITNTYNFLFNVEAREQIKKIDDAIKAKLINVQPT